VPVRSSSVEVDSEMIVSTAARVQPELLLTAGLVVLGVVLLVELTVGEVVVVVVVVELSPRTAVVPGEEVDDPRTGVDALDWPSLVGNAPVLEHAAPATASVKVAMPKPARRRYFPGSVLTPSALPRCTENSAAPRSALGGSGYEEVSRRVSRFRSEPSRTLLHRLPAHAQIWVREPGSFTGSGASTSTSAPFFDTMRNEPAESDRLAMATESNYAVEPAPQTL